MEFGAGDVMTHALAAQAMRHLQALPLFITRFFSEH
jgi:hypothetical protein